MVTKYGSPEHITKSWSNGGRVKHGYIVLVNVPGDDTYEVGLSALRKCLGLRQLTPLQAQILSANKPETIAFTGKCHESAYGPYNDLSINDESATIWADSVRGLL